MNWVISVEYKNLQGDKIPENVWRVARAIAEVMKLPGVIEISRTRTLEWSKNQAKKNKLPLNRFGENDQLLPETKEEEPLLRAAEFIPLPLVLNLSQKHALLAAVYDSVAGSNEGIEQIEPRKSNNDWAAFWVLKSTVKEMPEIEDADIDRWLSFVDDVRNDLKLQLPAEEAQKATPGPAKRLVEVSEDFSSVNWHGEVLKFSTNQITVVAKLWQYLDSQLSLRKETLFDDNIQSERMAIVFRDHPAWGRMILEAGKGSYRLADPNLPLPSQTPKVRTDKRNRTKKSVKKPENKKKP